MCISLLLYDAHPSLLLLLTFNRDEFWDRPTQPAHFWPDEPSLLAGRDALRQGTWLGVTRGGRFALLTNVREPMSAADPTAFVKSTAAPSRGALPTNFLTSSVSPMEYLQSLPLASYFGFNLLVGDLASRQVAYVSNRDPRGPQLLQPGHYGISNGLLQEWPKVDKCRRALASVLDLQQHAQAGSAAGARIGGSHEQQQDGSSTAQPPPPPLPGPVQQQAPVQAGGSGGGPDASGSSDSAGELPWQVLFQTVMGDSQLVPDHLAVPLTGVGEQLDRRLSSVFVEPFELQPGTPYGTRSQTVIAVWRDGRVQQRERYVEQVQEPQDQGEPGQVTWVWREQQHEFELAASPLPPPAAVAAAAKEQHDAELSEGEPAWHMFSAQPPPQQ